MTTLSPTGTITTADGCLVVVDLCDIPALQAYRWRKSKCPYVWTRFDNKTLYLHRLIGIMASGATMLCLKRPLVHHRDDNPLNNSRQNLQWTTQRRHTEIHRARGPKPGHRFKGVQDRSFANRRHPFRGYVRFLNKILTTGYFTTEEEAARAVDDLIRSLGLGDSAYLNYPEET